MPARSPLAIVAVSTALSLLAAADGGVNLLVNGDFDVVGPNGPAVESTGLVLVGESAAADWFVFHNSPGTTKTEILPSTCPGGGANMLRVQTDAPSNGIEQVVFAPREGPPCIKNGVWI